jgi:hypothetical protein
MNNYVGYENNLKTEAGVVFPKAGGKASGTKKVCHGCVLALHVLHPNRLIA